MKKTDLTKLSDEELVTLITESDQELYLHIMERYQGPLIRYARSFVHDVDAAEDVVQNTFIKAYQNLRGFKLDKKFSSWIYRITHNEAINYIKKHKREFRPEDETWFDAIEDDRPSPLDETERQLLAETTAATLASIDQKYREPIVLYFIEAKTYHEIAEILRIPPATVGTRIRRGKQQLKQTLQQKGVNHE